MSVRIDILSDPICPWCFIGKAQLDRAIAESGAEGLLDIRWRPFMLNPEMPPEGMDRRAYLEAKFGGRENAARIYARIAEAAEEAGLMLDLGAIERTPSTVDAHRLIHWAGIEGFQSDVVQRLFEAYFLEGRDISEHEVLADIADSAGMDGALVRRLLATDEDRELVRAADADARKMGVTGVPTFIVAGQYAVPGAQPAELWRKVIDEIREDR